uniref:Uncharacterized protein n=1 Tax=viral metagenome TaxID=1070528 RepID=A0A6M3LN66_9ZZZZ
MCQTFSCVVTRNGKVFWEAGVDSHDDLIHKFKVRDDTVDMEEISHAKIEIIPNNRNKYPYLYPDGKWKLQIDEQVTPSWFMQLHKDKAWEAWAEWKDVVYQFNVKEALHPVNPLKSRKGKPSKQDILLLKEWDSVGDSVWASVGASVGDSVWASVGDSVWASVRDSVGDSVGDSVRASVRASVGDSVRAYIGSLFPNIETWKYIKHEQGKYPYQSCVDLWKRGLIPSFDGKAWRLHSGKNASIVFEITRKELMKVK